MLRTQLTLEEVTKLSPQEEKVADIILKILATQNGSEQKLAEIIKIIASYPARVLYALSEKYPEINRLFETDPSLNEAWRVKLYELGYPYQPITSINGEFNLSVFSQLKGAYLLSEFAINPDFSNASSFALLNKACDIGMYSALIQRLNFYCEKAAKLLEGSNQSAALNHCMAIIFKDVHKLSNLYWTLGCIDSSLILFNLVTSYFKSDAHKIGIERFFAPAEIHKFSWLSEYDKPTIPIPISLLKTAVEGLETAKLLSTSPESKLIADQITHGKGFFHGIDEYVKDPAELNTTVKNKLIELNIPMPDYFITLAFDHSKDNLSSHATNNR